MPPMYLSEVAHLLVPRHFLFAQQGWSGPPQASHVPAAHVPLRGQVPSQQGSPTCPHLRQMFALLHWEVLMELQRVPMAQQGWPSPPHASQVPPMAVAPALQFAPAWHVPVAAVA